MIRDLDKLIENVVWSDQFERTGVPGQVLAVVLRYLYAVVRDFMSGQLTMRAMSLVYTTLLSVVPLLAFSFAILKGLGVFDQLVPYLDDLLSPLGQQGQDITAQILGLVENVNGKVLGTMGVAFFLWTAISTVQKVEEAFNYVWYVSKPRSFSRRFSEYLIVLMVGPMVMVTAISMITTIQSNAVVQWVMNSPALGPIFVFAGKFVPYVLISGVFTFMYMFMPNTRVSFIAALFGGIAGGVMWATMGAVFTSFILYATRTLQVYAAFAVGITTLIWLYLNWLVLLLGAQLAFYYQRPAFLRIGRQEPRLSNAMRERVALNIMLLVGQAFRAGDRITTHDVSNRLGIPVIGLMPIGIGLEDAGLLISTDLDELLPGREMAQISLNDILDIVRVEGETGSLQDPTWTDKIQALGTELDNAVAGVTGHRTLSDLLDEAPARA